MWREIALRLVQRDIRSTASKLPERMKTWACFNDAWSVIWLYEADSVVMGLIIVGRCDIYAVLGYTVAQEVVQWKMP